MCGFRLTKLVLLKGNRPQSILVGWFLNFIAVKQYSTLKLADYLVINRIELHSFSNSPMDVFIQTCCKLSIPGFCAEYNFLQILLTKQKTILHKKYL